MSRSPAKYLFPAIAALALSATAAMSAELPTYDVTSFPATPVQLSVLGASRAQEQAPTATLTRNDMPATPVQLSVLTPRHRNVAAEVTATASTARN